MTNTKQLRLTTDFLNSPFFRTSVGFDHFFDQILNHASSAPNYPPYNIIRNGDHYSVEMAVAGFSEDDIEITVDNQSLKVVGRTKDQYSDETAEVLHQGIASRSFERTFKLAEHVVVSGASLKNGMLTVTMHQEVPEQLKPKRITINQ